MPGPGYVVTPSGARKWVPDKWAYFQEHPESFQRTLDDIKAVNAAAEARDTVQTQPQRVSTEKSSPDCCVDKWVLKACEECNAS